MHSPYRVAFDAVNRLNDYAIAPDETKTMGKGIYLIVYSADNLDVSRKLKSNGQFGDRKQMTGSERIDFVAKMSSHDENIKYDPVTFTTRYIIDFN